MRETRTHALLYPSTRPLQTLGIDAYIVDVEMDLAFGLPSFFAVAMPDVAVKESRDRAKAAIKNARLDFPARRITVNLSVSSAT